MSEKATQYLKLINQLQEVDDSTQEYDDILDVADHLWWAMSDTERQEVECNA